MDRATIEPAIRIVLTEIHSKLNEAPRIAKPRRPVRAGSVTETVTVSMDIGPTDLRGRPSARCRLAAQSALPRIAANFNGDLAPPPIGGSRQ
jgi:hypothetical protein